MGLDKVAKFWLLHNFRTIPHSNQSNQTILPISIYVVAEGKLKSKAQKHIKIESKGSSRGKILYLGTFYWWVDINNFNDNVVSKGNQQSERIKKFLLFIAFALLNYFLLLGNNKSDVSVEDFELQIASY